MRSSFMIGCLAVLALFVSQFVASTKAQQVAAPKPKLSEYKVFQLDPLLFTVVDDSYESDNKHEVGKLLQQALNNQAAEGWEYSGGFQGYLIFKRQK